ncbi:l-Fucosyltransferase [Trichonephila clavipes]|nr:l-Fucosyltransferase [Trichonephila clavipes]
MQCTATHRSLSWCDDMGCHYLQYTVTPSIDPWHHMTAQRCVHDILQPHVLPLMQRLRGVSFQQDNARPHMARVSQDCLRTVTTLR